MKYFKLPDLGEGLMEAEIVEWFVKKGDTVKVDQALVAMETAKAIVQVPSPTAGKIIKLMGQAGTIIHTGEVLIEFEGDAQDAGTVVGSLNEAPEKMQAETFEVYAVDEQLVDNDFGALLSLKQLGLKTSDSLSTEALETQFKHCHESGLRGVQKSMARAMRDSRTKVVPATMIEEADISAWPEHEDVTVRLLLAMAYALQKEPGLNAFYFADRQEYIIQKEVNIGLAIDTEEGLFVPVIRDVFERKKDDLRQAIGRIRSDVEKRSIPAEELRGATITLSNFGMIAGLFGTPIIVPPQVAILGAGRFTKRLAKDGDEIVEKTYLPLSLTFDHQVITGAEAARFLKAIIDHLAK